MEPELAALGIPAERLDALATLLDRAATLTEPEIRQLALRYRTGPEATAVGIRDRDQQERQARWARTIRTAAARGGRQRDVRVLTAICESAVRRALAGTPSLGPLGALGVLDDAAAAVTNAALAIALRDRLGADVAADLSSPWVLVANGQATSAAESRS